MTRKPHWTPEGIAWSDLDRSRVADSEELFYMVTSASFIEITSDLYTSNLVQHFAGDEEVSDWLRNGWEPEELAHGRALREYVRRVWPEFDWDKYYAGYLAEYGPLCKPERLLPLRSLEMAQRCVIETGTASYYTALHHASDEPVLAQITRNIFEDEVGHYKHFYKYFRRYRQIESTNRVQVLGALWGRLRVMDDEDTYLAIKHLYSWRRPDAPYDRSVYQSVIKRIRAHAGPHFPLKMSINMLLKPLDMPAMAQRMLTPVMEGIARRAVA